MKRLKAAVLSISIPVLLAASMTALAAMSAPSVPGFVSSIIT